MTTFIDFLAEGVSQKERAHINKKHNEIIQKTIQKHVDIAKARGIQLTVNSSPRKQIQRHLMSGDQWEAHKNLRAELKTHYDAWDSEIKSLKNKTSVA